MTETPKKPDQSPLRGTLRDNADRPSLHDMGGRTGPASDRTAAADADTGRRSDGIAAAQQRAQETGATAVHGSSRDALRDDPGDPAGGDSSRTTTTDAPHPTEPSRDPHDASVGRGADGDTRAREAQKHEGGP